ncbi:hypothetical protein [Burkholderia lata]|uniref:hypothetical protein n=1 Tax=Burkholderia lata (strain ATCC 17760 / DSM 23089 / LMG 22485 / NCIMB 9086 / R18194 / 383) TaxID=482957 RepID=UPI001C2E2122|nr:hypothetical protein [Burkholderia lata]
MAWLVGAFVIASSAQAEGPRVLPRSEQADSGYASTQLLLKPCVDVRKLSDDPDDDLLKAAAAARAALPPGTCDNAALAEKVFTARIRTAAGRRRRPGWCARHPLQRVARSQDAGPDQHG